MSTIKILIKLNETDKLTVSVNMDTDDTLSEAVQTAIDLYVEAVENGNYTITESDGLISHFISGEGKLSDDFFDCRDDAAEEDIKIAWLENGMDWDGNAIHDAYQGKFESDAEFVRDFCDQTGVDYPSWMSIDWEQTARDVMMDYFESNGYYFRN